MIPEVLEVVKTKRPPGAKEFDLFEHVGGKCPVCGGPIAKDKSRKLRSRDDREGDEVKTALPSSQASRSSREIDPDEEVAWRCQNVAGCPAQLTRRVEYFAAPQGAGPRVARRHRGGEACGARARERTA